MTRALAALLLLTSASLARDDGRFAQVDERTRQWFRSQKVPGGDQRGMSCCDMADGVYAEEDIRQGEYWVRYVTREGVNVDWQKVPKDALITEPNGHGRAVVWYWFMNAVPQIRCFIPGAGI